MGRSAGELRNQETDARPNMLKSLNLNLLSGLIIAIVLLGAVSAVTVFINAQTYRDLAFNFQRQQMAQRVEQEIGTIMAEQTALAHGTARLIEEDAVFRTAFLAGDTERLADVLGQQYLRQPPVPELADSAGLYLFDKGLKLLASARRDAGRSGSGAIVCPALADRVRTPARNAQPVFAHDLCMHDDVLHAASIVPVGSETPGGFLQVAYDPLTGLGRLGERLDMHVRIVDLQDNPLFASRATAPAFAAHVVETVYELRTANDTPVLRIHAARDADDLISGIEDTNRRLLVIVAVALLFSVVVALLIVKYSVFKPLQSLSRQLKARWSPGNSGAGAGESERDPPVSFHALGELYETLRDMAIRDPLTGTYNRALLEDRLSQLIAEHRRNPGCAAVLLTDMVRFKYVNDMLGHHTGDLLLQKVVGRMSDVLRESDTLARLGGDEFVILLPDTDAGQAEQVAGKIIQSMQREFEVKGHKLSASVNIGIALMPDHGTEVDELLRNADYAMYTAKSGNQGYAIHDPATASNIASDRMSIDGKLTEDISRNNLFLVYQPVIEFASDSVYYLEALVRWRQPDGRILMPDAFIRAAEQSGMIRQLSEWVIDSACRELSLMQAIDPGLRSGINLSMHNLHDFKLMIRIEDALARYQLDAGSLLLEITESGVMLDPDQVIEILEQLAAMGLKLSIDDFGTGHSSLVHLRRLPVHTLKVDKSFVADMDADEENASIVRATIDLGHSLGLTVTAEGVETRSVHDLLRRMRCDYYQGYYVGMPMTMEEVKRWLGEGPARLQDVIR